MKISLPRSNIRVYGEIHITPEGNHIDSARADGYTFVPDDVSTFYLASSVTGKSGVYEIRNKDNGRIYIGQSRNIVSRIDRHKRDLIQGNHKSKLLQSDFNTIHNKRVLDLICTSSLETIMDVFEFSVIHYCPPSQLTFWENLLIKAIKPEYNTKK